MDIKYLKEKIYHLDEQRKIQPGEYLSAEVISILRDGKTTDRIACFTTSEKNTNPKKDVVLFTAELTCSDCGNEIIQELTKTALLDYLKGTNKIICKECQVKLELTEQIKKEQKIKEEEQYAKQKIINTEEYIKNYLSPGKEWDVSIKPYERQNIIIQNNKIDSNIIAQHIRNMPYNDFLKTPYWSTISAYKKYQTNYKCSICSSKNNLSTHHSTYERHGYEHLYTVIKNDLIVLCQSCHDKFHDKI